MKRHPGGALRTSAFVLGSVLVLFACTFTRDLDYLNEGTPDSGPEPSSEGGGSSTASSSGAGGEAGAIAGTVLVGSQANPDHLVQDATYLYWSVDTNAIMRVAKAGGPAQEVVKLGAGATIDALAVDAAADGRVYFITGGGVQWAPKAGGAPTVFLPPATEATSLAADDQNVFVTRTLAADEGTSTLTRYAKDNAAAATNLSPAQETETVGVALTNDAVFWSANDAAGDYVLNQAPKTAAGPPPAIVFQNTGKDPEDATIQLGIEVEQSSELAIDDQAIYWIDFTYSAPYVMPRAQPKGKAVPLLNPKSSAAKAIFVDARFVYVTNDPDGGPPQLVRIGKVDPFKAEPFAAQPGPLGVVADDSAIFYTFSGAGGVGANGGIQRVPK